MAQIGLDYLVFRCDGLFVCLFVCVQGLPKNNLLKFVSFVRDA